MYSKHLLNESYENNEIISNTYIKDKKDVKCDIMDIILGITKTIGKIVSCNSFQIYEL